MPVQLKPCRHCEKDVSPDSKSCPFCGCSHPIISFAVVLWSIGSMLMSLGLLLILLWFALAFIYMLA